VDNVLVFSSGQGSTITRESGFGAEDAGYNSLSLSKFDVIFGMPFAFGLPDHLLEAFENAPKLGSIVKSNSGTKTGENEIFVKYWWEVDPLRIERNATGSEDARVSEKKWFPFTKGGAPLKWYGGMIHVVDWENDGERIRAGVKSDGGKRFFQLMSASMVFRPYVCWSHISNVPAFRLSPFGFMANVKSPSVTADDLNGLLAFLNSKVVSVIIKKINPTIGIEIRDVESLPVLLNISDLAELGALAVAEAKYIWNMQELSMDFDIDNHLTLLRHGLEQYSHSIEMLSRQANLSMLDIQERIDQVVSPTYGINPDSLRDPQDDPMHSTDSNGSTEVVLEGESVSEPYVQALSVISGIILGRYPAPQECKALVDDDNVVPMMLENYFDDDFSSRLPLFLSELTSGEQDGSLYWLLGQIGQPVRLYMRKVFYQNHLKIFKGAPIYWVIRSPGGHFQALTYIHRLSVDTFAVCRRKYVQPLIEKMLAQQNALSSSDPKKAAYLGTQIKDLAILDERLYEIVVNPPVLDFDEGVVKNHARFASVLQKIK
jgi:hypothetical protein